ncbi:MAG: hypothetical protein IJN16_01225 [Lachnospiraceae bacterium]|nr:hypothetical protein [Lachnospiraceae bacterium]
MEKGNSVQNFVVFSTVRTVYVQGGGKRLKNVKYFVTDTLFEEKKCGMV